MAIAILASGALLVVAGSRLAPDADTIADRTGVP
jgi:hypothetical protein